MYKSAMTTFRAETRINNEKFIAEVKQRRALWDTSYSYYHDKMALNKGWNEIASIFEIDVPVAKQKWKNLRDTFRVELKKTLRCSEEDLETLKVSKSLWAHYDEMMFLKDSMKSRKPGDLVSFSQLDFGAADHNTSTEMSGAEDNSIEAMRVKNEVCFSPVLMKEVADDEASSIFEPEVSQSQAHSSREAAPRRNTAKRKRSEEKAAFFEEDESDDDLLFFRSLLPYVKRLPENKKLTFRTNIQQMLYNELYDY